MAAAATSLLSLCGSAALADSEADGAASGSPGVLSGNNLQVPVSVPVNVCGNSANVVGLLNPAFGNTCADGGSGAVAQSSTPSQSGAAGSTDSPGVASGNNLQVPVSVPVNVCGNSADVVGVLNPAFGNSCADGGSGAVAQSSTPSQSGAAGSTDSPGVASGNNLQVPVSVPVNVCGNSADVVGAHNPTVGNSCAGNGTEDEALINIPSQPGAPDEDSAASSGDSDDTSSAVPGDGGDTSSVVPGDGDDTTSVVPGDGGDTTSVVPGDGGDTSSVSRNEQDAEQPVFASVPSGTSPSGESVRTTELDTDEVDPYSTAAEPVSAWSRHTLAETGSANMAAAAVASAALIVGGTAILYRRRPATRRR